MTIFRVILETSTLIFTIRLLADALHFHKDPHEDKIRLYKAGIKLPIVIKNFGLKTNSANIFLLFRHCVYFMIISTKFYMNQC